MTNRRVTVLMGGPDAEHNVSIDSGTEVANALDLSGQFEVNRKIIEKITVDELLALQADVFFQSCTDHTARVALCKHYLNRLEYHSLGLVLSQQLALWIKL